MTLSPNTPARTAFSSSVGYVRATGAAGLQSVAPFSFPKASGFLLSLTACPKRGVVLPASRATYSEATV